MLCEEFGFHLAQEFYWWNPSKLPTPAEWVTVRRVCAARHGLAYSPRQALPQGQEAWPNRNKFGIDNGAAIPPNLIAMPNTESNSFYLR